MTDQDRPNSTSDNTPEVVTEYTLCDNFIRQYKKYKLGMLDGDVWTIREQQALTASMIADPVSMLSFINATAALVMTTAKEEFATEDDVVDCLSNFHSCIYSVIFTVVVPLLKLPEDEKAAIRQAYITMMKLNKTERGSEDPFANLDFKVNPVDPKDLRSN